MLREELAELTRLLREAAAAERAEWAEWGTSEGAALPPSGAVPPLRARADAGDRPAGAPVADAERED